MNPLETLKTLDQKILEAHEFIVQKAHTELGWNKYDLARGSGYLIGGAMSTVGIYGTIMGVLGESAPLIASSVMPLAGGLGAAYFCNFISDVGEKLEIRKMVESGAR